MRSSLTKRIERLESVVPAAAPVYFRYGTVKPLPADYDGPRHVVAVTSTPTRSPYVVWCEFEERQGAKSADDGSFVVYLEK
jgi:hypothetical protein